MKRQIRILGSIYLVVMIIGGLWCHAYFRIETMVLELLLKTIIWALLGYGLYLVIMVLDRTKILQFLMRKIKIIMTYIAYIYLTIFLLEAFIGLVMVFLFKDYIYAYSFFAIMTVLHATKLTNTIIAKYNTY